MDDEDETTDEEDLAAEERARAARGDAPEADFGNVSGLEEEEEEESEEMAVDGELSATQLSKPTQAPGPRTAAAPVVAASASSSRVKKTKKGGRVREGLEEQPHTLREDGEPRRDFLHRTFVDAMCERFLRGEDKEYVDYNAIDANEALDDVKLLDRDAEERYFDDTDDGADHRPAEAVHVSEAVQSADGVGSGSEIVSGAGAADDGEDDYMKFDLSKLG
jgi:hypothetical protein